MHLRYLYQSWDDKKEDKHIPKTDTNQGTTRRRPPGGAVPQKEDCENEGSRFITELRRREGPSIQLINMDGLNVCNSILLSLLIISRIWMIKKEVIHI